LDSQTLRMGPIGCPETSVRSHRHSLPNNPEELNSHLLRGGSLKPRNDLCLQQDIFITVRVLKDLQANEWFPCSYWISGCPNSLHLVHDQDTNILRAILNDCSSTAPEFRKCATQQIPYFVDTLNQRRHQTFWSNRCMNHQNEMEKQSHTQ